MLVDRKDSFQCCFAGEFCNVEAACDGDTASLVSLGNTQTGSASK